MTSSPQSSHLKLSFASLVSLLGTASAIYLTQLYYRIRSGTGGFRSLCDFGEGYSCDVVATSKWAELVPGLPLSSVVAGFFVALLILSLLGRMESWRKDVAKIGAILSGVGLLYGVVLLYVMFGVVQSICVFCLAIDAALLILFLLFLSMKEGKLFSDLPGKRLQSSAILLVVSVFVMVVILRPVENSEAQTASKAEIEMMARNVLEAKVEDVKVPATAPVIGDANAPITIVEFSDFQCPFCGRAARVLNSVVARYPKQVKVVFRNFPLDQACNREITRSMHPHACALARAAHCASEKGKFKPVYERIFELQDSLTGESAVQIAGEAGIPEAEIKACLDAETTKAAVSADVEDGIALKIQSTPTLFVNGRRVEGAYPLEVWDKVIPELLKQK